MRVLYFSDNTSDHNRRFLQKLSQAGVEAWFMDPTSDRLPDGWLPDGVRWVQVRQRMRRGLAPSDFAGFLNEFQNCLKQIRPDLVHAGPTHNCGYLTGLSGFHPWLLTSWGSDILSIAGQRELRKAVEFALSTADGFFCDCDAVRAKAKQLANVADARIVQFPWGIRKGSFTPKGDRPAENAFVREPDTCVFISTRSWEPVYGIEVLLRAFQIAHTSDPSLRLLLLGNGSGAPQIREFISSHGLDHVIRIPGHISREDMPRWFRAADVYVSCTRSDGTSVSLLEAMATGLPVVVTDIPSNREWVVQPQNGWLASADSAEEFADRLLLAARLVPQQRDLISRRNQRVVEERADWDRNFPRLLEMYEQLVSLQVRS
jgi:L-malate glycosyltransferase